MSHQRSYRLDCMTTLDFNWHSLLLVLICKRNYQCKIQRSHFSKRCRDLGHQQKGVKATLRFFECTNCRRRKSCTDRIPQTGCEFCGKHEWKPCGAHPGRGHAEDSRDKRFVAAMSEVSHSRDGLWHSCRWVYSQGTKDIHEKDLSTLMSRLCYRFATL